MLKDMICDIWSDFSIKYPREPTQMVVIAETRTSRQKII